MPKIRIFTCIFLLLNFIFNLHILFFYQTNLSSMIFYGHFLQISRLLSHLFSPLLFMSIFSVLIYKNWQQTRHHVTPFMINIVHNHPTVRKQRLMNTQTYLMLLCQCSTYFLWNIPPFIKDFCSFLALICPCLTSLVFFLSSSLYRQQLVFH